MTDFVEGCPFASGSSSAVTTRSRSSLTREESTERIARRRIRFGSLCRKLRGFGPKTTPPPRRCGARFEPCRAAPRPFWRLILRVEPLTSPRDLVEAVPARRAAS